MVSDLEARERAAFASARQDEEMGRKLKEEIRAMRASTNESVKTGDSDLEKMLKVTWEKGGENYKAQILKELFSKFGEVEDVVISSSKKKRSALVQMANKQAAVAATRRVSGNLSNPLLVLPIKPADYPSIRPTTRVNDLVGIGFKLYEDSILEKLKKG